MAIRLEKGQKINLEKDSGAKLTQFCVGCNWGAIERYVECKKFGFIPSQKKEIVDVDLDLSCIMVDAQGDICDYIYSPAYVMPEGIPHGKLNSVDHAFHHSGDDRQGDVGGDDGLDNEIITVDLTRVSPEIHQVFFFLNIFKSGDFSQVPYASIRMYEGTPERVNSVFASYNVAAQPNYVGKTALIMAKLYRYQGNWKFAAIGDAYNDNVLQSIARILRDYAK